MMRGALLLLLVAAAPAAAVFQCPPPEENLPTYDQLAQDVLDSLNSSQPMDLLGFANAYNESTTRLRCESDTPAFRTIGVPVKINRTRLFHPLLWPNGILHYTILRSNYSPAALARIEKEIQYVNDSTCVTFIEVESCSGLKKCAMITPPTIETLKNYPPSGALPEDYKTYYMGRVSDMVETDGILDWIMWALGFLPEHTRFDRDDHLALIPMEGVNEEWMNRKFIKSVQSIVHTVFPYDPQSVTHITVYLAALYGVNITTLNPEHVIKYSPDGILSEIDIHKIHYYYCYKTMTYHVSSLPPEIDLPTDTTDATTSDVTLVTQPPQETETITDQEPEITEIQETTTTTTTTTPDPRFTLVIALDGLDEETHDGSIYTTTASPTTAAATTTEKMTTTTTIAPTTTFYPLTSAGVLLTANSLLEVLQSSLLLVSVLTYVLS